jgi:acetate kinase
MALPILVLNCGSSSLKAAVIGDDGAHLADAHVEDPADIATAVDGLIDTLLARPDLAGGFAAVGHRVVHGGERFTVPTRIDTDVEAAIEALIPLAPLHNPPALAGIRAARARLPMVAHIAVFDTAFHATLPRRAREYALPRELAKRLGLRRYGFHGTSHAYVAAAAAHFLDTPLARLRLVSCHLGAGASVTAVEYGRSVETSMGLTPLEGLVMAKRSGDLDPGVVLAMWRSGLTLEEVSRLLDGQSGLLGLSGTADMREVERRAAAGDDPSRLALLVYAHRIRKYIGAYAAVMGGIDGIVFTGGVGENSAVVRHRIAQRLEFLGAELDEDRNRDARVSALQRVAEISAAHARCPLLVVATDEQVAIAAAARQIVCGEAPAFERVAQIPVAVSARHLHLTRASVEALFGPGRTLTRGRPLSQPGQFAAEETVTLVGPAGRLEHVRIIGPERAADQVEISRTDEYALGVDAPVRESGDLANTPGIRVEGPAGAVTLKSGVICALRHIHMNPDDARRFGVADGDVVDVHIETAGRNLTFGEVRVRVRADFQLEMHVDTDEANAAGIPGAARGVLESVDRSARLTRRR